MKVKLLPVSWRIFVKVDLPKRSLISENLCKKQKDGLMTVNECCKALGIGGSKWYAKAKELAI